MESRDQVKATNVLVDWSQVVHGLMTHLRQTNTPSPYLFPRTVMLWRSAYSSMEQRLASASPLAPIDPHGPAVSGSVNRATDRVHGRGSFMGPADIAVCASRC